jgi:hypothetical protein
MSRHLAAQIENYQDLMLPPDGGVTEDDLWPRRVFATADAGEKFLDFKLDFLRALADHLGAKLQVRYEEDPEKIRQVLEDKQNSIARAGLDQWIYTLYGPSKDAGQGWVFSQNHPDVRARMMAILQAKHAILSQLFELKVKSFPDKSDALLLFVLAGMKYAERRAFLTWLTGNDSDKDALRAMKYVEGAYGLTKMGEDKSLGKFLIGLSGTKGEGMWRQRTGNEQPGSTPYDFNSTTRPPGFYPGARGLFRGSNTTELISNFFS